MAYTTVKVPTDGSKISIKDGKLQVPDNPIIPFVEGDGTGVTSGGHALEYSMRLLRKLMVVNVRFDRWKFILERRPTRSSKAGCLMRL